MRRLAAPPSCLVLRAALGAVALAGTGPTQGPANEALTAPALDARGEPIVGTVLDPDGKPIADATVELWRRPGRGWLCLDLVYAREERRVATAVTSSRGTFTLQPPHGLPCELRIDVPQWARLVRPDVLGGQTLELRLEPGAVFEGTVTLAPTGTPIADAELTAWNAQRIEVLRGRTDAAGQYRFTRLPSGSLTFRVEAHTAASCTWTTLTREPGEVRRHDLALTADVALVGTVTDADTGKPIAGAEIGEGWSFHKAVRTDADGRYRMLGFGSEGYHEVHVHAPGYGAQQVPSPQDATPRLDFSLQRGIAVRGRILRPDGKPAHDVYVAVVGMLFDVGVLATDWQPARTAVDGTFAVDGLRHGLPHALLVRQDGFATTVFDVAAPRGDVQLPDVTLEPRRVVTGSVVDEKGRPVANATVVLLGANADRRRLVGRAYALPGLTLNVLERSGARRSFTTDASGRFSFGDVPAGSFEVGLHRERVRVPVDVTNSDPDPVVLVQG